MSNPEAQSILPLEERQYQELTPGPFACGTDIVAEMQRIAPPGQDFLPATTQTELRTLTGHLLSVDGATAEAEYDRFTTVMNRGLLLPQDKLHNQLSGKTIVVTGGTGCIGTALLKELQDYHPARLISVSRGVTAAWGEIPDVEYAHDDIRHADEMEQLFYAVKPDIVYHLAAQRDPGLAETEVARTVTTNVFGTRNVIAAARNAATPQVVYASTGKALRPFTPDTYASSKKASEWLMAQAVERGDIVASGVRFTHVVDNSIIHQRIQSWIANDTPIRLHGPDILFYVQSAKESAHLLLNSGLEAGGTDFRIQAIRDLEWPVSLANLALGALAKSGKVAPIYFCGFESGYEEHFHPALYDPAFAGEVSPLINAIEAPEAHPSAFCSQVDVFPFVVQTNDAPQAQLQNLEELCRQSASTEALHRAKDKLSWAMLDARLQSIPIKTLQHIAQRMQQLSQHHHMDDDHARTNTAVYTALKTRS